MESQSARHINIIPINQVIYSGISYIVFKNIMTARARIAQNAPCSRYLYFARVHFFTNIIVILLTNIAQIPSQSAIIKIFLLRANAQITPSKEKLASKTSRYKNKESQTFDIFAKACFGAFKRPVSHSIRTKMTIQITDEERNENISA